MPHWLPFSAANLLDAIDGHAYVVDGNGRILGFSRGPFIPENGGATPTPWDSGLAVGTDIFSLVQDEATRQAYRTLHDSVWYGARPSIGFEYRCDGPEVERRMRMSLSLIRVDATPLAVLYQSIIVSEAPRVPVPLFAAELLASRATGYTDDQLVTLCSYCLDAAWPTGAGVVNPEWIKATDYYQRGGRSDVVVSHGICEACYQRIVEPSIQALRARKAVAAPTR